MHKNFQSLAQRASHRPLTASRFVRKPAKKENNIAPNFALEAIVKIQTEIPHAIEIKIKRGRGRE